jgi:glucan exporter ATP-binding protein
MSIASVYLRVLSLLGREKNLAIFLAFANLALAIAQFAEPVLFGRVIDKLSGAKAASGALSFADLLPLLGAWVGFGFASIPLAVVVALQADRLAHRRRLAVMAQFFDHVLHLPLSFHSSAHSGRLLKVMIEGANGMAVLWLSFFRENCASLAALLILLPLSLILNWRLASMLMALVFVFGFLTAYVLRHTQSLQQQVERHNSSLAEHVSDALGNISVIQSFTRIDVETKALRRITDAVLEAQMPVLTWWAVAAVGARASATLTLLSIFLLGAWLNLRGLATIGEIVTFMNFAAMLIARLEQVVSFVNNLFMQSPKLKDFFNVLDTVPQVADNPFAVDPGRLKGKITFDHVTFSYDGKRNAISDVTFEVEPGQTVALVGATGSGKSTALGLLHRVFDPTRGNILIDGINIRDMTLASLRRNIGVVFQEPMLFARSIEENIQVGRPDATAAEISVALELAQADEFVARQSEGLATIVGERGRSLSGGERQRVSIARALLKNPPIMIFDEATAALDATTERQLQKALEKAMEGRTTFVIAHRLATVRAADRIFVFDQGEIVEAGTFDELVAKNGRFAALARAQFMVTEEAAPRKTPDTSESPFV